MIKLGCSQLGRIGEEALRHNGRKVRQGKTGRKGEE